MYSFTDRGGEEITLRPEGTAGVVRALISGGLVQDLPLKFFYAGPMFRYERPQKGRQRQFHQIGIELLGVAEPQADIEVITCGAHILDALGLSGSTQLEINTLGDGESRAAYRAALVQYFSGHRDRLSEDSRARLERNPLRILDSKDQGDRKLIENAPRFSDYLNHASRDFFAKVLGGLSALGIGYTINERLVRGLDYYCHTAFEFTTNALGAQGTVMAGGRYDGLVEMMGGPSIPGIGWGAGIERLAMLLAAAPEAPHPLALVPAGDAADAYCLALAQELRRAGHRVDLFYRGNMGRRLKRADKVGAKLALIVGEDELAHHTVTLRDLASGQQQTVPQAGLVEYLKPYL
jgi:histidyl-tRNA synthetase